MSRALLDAPAVARVVDRIAHQLLEKTGGAADTVILGIPTRGVPLARRLAARIRTFEAVTGPKTDLWLVKTVGVLVAVIGAVLATAGLRGRVPPELALLGAGGALGRPLPLNTNPLDITDHRSPITEY